MSTLESLIDPLRRSPQLPQAIALLNQHLQSERAKRDRFYAEMTAEQKVEFIDGEVVVHSPARSRHRDVTTWIVKLLHTHVDMHRLGAVKAEKCLCVFPRNDYEPDSVSTAP